MAMVHRNKEDIQMNGASIVVLVIVVICLVFAFKKVINDKKNGCSGCNMCSNKGHCYYKDNNIR